MQPRAVLEMTTGEEGKAPERSLPPPRLRPNRRFAASSARTPTSSANQSKPISPAADRCSFSRRSERPAISGPNLRGGAEPTDARGPHPFGRPPCRAV